MSDQKNKMGLLGTVALIVSGMVGCGILILPKSMAKFGTWGFLSCFLAAYMAYSIFKSFIRVRTKYMNDNVGSNPNIIDFLKMLYCDTTSFLITFGHFTGISASCAAIAYALSQYLIPLITDFQVCDFTVMLVAILSLLLVFLINLVSTKLADYLNQSLNVVKVVFFFVIAIIGSFYFRNYNIDFVDGARSLPLLFLGAATAMFTFMGIEFAIFASDSIAEPHKNIEKGTLIGLIITTLIFFGVYSACSFVIADLANCDTPVSTLALFMFGAIGAKIVGIIAILSCLTSLNGCLMVQGNSFRVFVKKGWLPEKLGKQNESGFPFFGALFSIMLSSLWLLLPFLNSELIQTMAVCFIAMVYLAIVLVDLKVSGFKITTLLGLLSSLIMLCQINYSVIMIMIVIYASAYLIKSCTCSKEVI